MKADEALIVSWRQQPAETVRLILRVSGDLGQAETWLRGRGVRVRRRCRLINGLAIECSGAQAEALLPESWVARIEPDAPVSALSASHGG